MYYIFFTILAIAILFEGLFTTIPLVFICLLCYLIVMKKPFVFYTAFFAGLILDLFTVRNLGSTFIFLLLFFYLVLLYRKKYEIESYPFVLVTTFVGSYLYGSIYGSSSAVMLAGMSGFIAILLFAFLKQKLKFQDSKSHYNS